MRLLLTKILIVFFFLIPSVCIADDYGKPVDLTSSSSSVLPDTDSTYVVGECSTPLAWASMGSDVYQTCTLGTAADPAYEIGVGGDGFFSSGAGQLDIAVGGTGWYRILNSSIYSYSTGGFQINRVAASDSNPSYSFNDDGSTGVGSSAASIVSFISNGATKVEVSSAGIIYTPSADTAIVAGTGLTVTNSIQRVVGSGGAIQITATPNIAAGVKDGQIVIIQGTDNTNTVEFQDADVLANSGLALSGNTNFVMGNNDTLQLMYDSGESLWVEISRGDNN